MAVVAGRGAGPRFGIRPMASRVDSIRRTVGDSEDALTVTLGLAVIAVAFGIGRFPPFDPIFLLFPIVGVAGFVLSPKRLLVIDGAALLVAIGWQASQWKVDAFGIGLVLSLLVAMTLSAGVARSRAKVGTRGLSGDRMFADLRDRISSAGRIPPLPLGWSATSCVLSANSDQFSGDFVVVCLLDEGRRLEVALLDVSGKGRKVGTRSLLLSGAVGALLGAVPARDFLTVANEYLLRQRWEEGFATAVHLEVDLDSGVFSVANAGHPTPAHYTSGRGMWSAVETRRGPLLGVIPGAEYPRYDGRLESGDSLLLYSDGVVEVPGTDLADGFDRMLGIAARSVLDDGDIAHDVCVEARSGPADDRAAFVIRRS
jgi:hypothetical protein